MDTIGAGDTFNATVIASLSLGHSLKEALTIGCKVAGTKVGQFGFCNLKKVFYDLSTYLIKERNSLGSISAEYHHYFDCKQ